VALRNFRTACRGTTRSRGGWRPWAAACPAA